MKYLIIIVICIFLSSCNDDNAQTNIDVYIDMSIKNSAGSDLLNPTNSNSLDESNIKIIYEIDGEQIEFNEPDLTASRGFFIFQHENKYRIRIFPNTDKNTPFPITYIKWNDVDTDTLKCEIERKSNSETCTKVWLNEEVVWDSYGGERFIEIVK